MKQVKSLLALTAGLFAQNALSAGQLHLRRTKLTTTVEHIDMLLQVGTVPQQAVVPVVKQIDFNSFDAFKRSDKKFLLKAFANPKIKIDYHSLDDWSLHDKDILKAAILSGAIIDFAKVSPWLSGKRDIIVLALSYPNVAIDFKSINAFEANEKEVAIAALKGGRASLEDISPWIRDDDDVIEAALS